MTQRPDSEHMVEYRVRPTLRDWAFHYGIAGFTGCVMGWVAASPGPAWFIVFWAFVNGVSYSLGLRNAVSLAHSSTGPDYVFDLRQGRIGRKDPESGITEWTR